MTLRRANDASRKAPKMAKLELHRDTVQELTQSEAGDVAGGQVFRPRPGSKKCATHVGGCTNNVRCVTNFCGPTGGCVSCSGNICTSV